MHSKFVLLLLAALQVSYSVQWERPHIRYYSRWDTHKQPDSYEDQSPGSNYEDSHHQPLTRDCHCSPHHDDDIKPAHEDQSEDIPSRRDSFLRDEESHMDGESAEAQNGIGHVYMHGRPRHDDCEIFVNPIRPRHDGGEIFVNPIRPRHDGGEIFVNPIRPRHDGCEIFVNPIRPRYDGGKIFVNPIRPRPDGGEIFVNPIRPRPDGGEIFVNPIRPPYQGPIGKPTIEELSAYPGIGRRPASQLISEGISGGEYQSKVASLSDEIINSQLGGLTNQDVQPSIADSAIHQRIGAAGVSPGNTQISALGPIEVTPLLPFLPSGVGLPINQPIIGSSPPALVAPTLPLSVLPSPNFCIRHRLVPVPIRVVEECITNVPVVRKTVHHQVETVTRHVPVVQKTVTQQHEKIVRHVPVSGKTLRNVVETRVRHIPVIKSRTRTVVEPYTVHIPVTIRFTRPVEESITKTVPIHEVRTRPIVTERTRLVPVVERRIRPIVEQRTYNVPVKKQYLKTVVEQRARPVVGPCQPCILPAQSISSNLISTEDIPRILLSPYSDLGGASSGAISPLGAINTQLGSAVPGGLARSGPVNGQITASSGHHSGIPYGQTGGSSLSPSVTAEIGIPLQRRTIPNLYDRSCSPSPLSC